MNLALRLNLFFFYNYIGHDEFGNKYYEQKKAQSNKKNKRMVNYKGINEASKVPAKYHGWLHHYSDNFPKTSKSKHKWQKQHLPNLSGTKYAYEPKNINQGIEHSNKSREYTSWSPKE
jgi:NADH:ubiquinone oxidoreductase subunit